ncbi:MAG: serine hydrolase domain-containing protein [Spirochaetales bacterium]
MRLPSGQGGRPLWARIVRIALIVLGVAVVVAAAVLLATVSFRNQADTAEFVRTKLARAGVPGAAIVMTSGEEIAWTSSFGYADVEHERPVTAETRFQLASVSKTVTGTAVMQLAERGLVGLDQDISTVLPFAIVHPEHPDVPITIRMLLTHSSSISEQSEPYESLYTIGSGGGDSPVTLEEVARGFLTEGGRWYADGANFADTAPGTARAYSNVGYALLGYIVEVVSRDSFPDYCRENIFEPLGMDSATWMLADTDLDRLAVPYEGRSERLPFYSFATYPDGTLRATAEDYAAFLIAMLNGGALHGNRILEPETVHLMLGGGSPGGGTPLTWHPDPLGDLGLYAPDGEVLGHTGGDPGVFTVAMFNPVRRTGLVVLMNSSPAINLRVLNLWLMMRRLIEETGL